jgi:endoglucanase
VQVSNEGIPTIVIGIPIRYMHTPVEVVSLQDIKRVERLLSAIMDKLDEKFLKKISWDDSDEK